MTHVELVDRNLIKGFNSEISSEEEKKNGYSPSPDRQLHRRQVYQKYAKLQLELNLKTAQQELEAYEKDCSFCRGIPKGARQLKYDCDSRFGLIVDHENETATCPECNECLAAWE